MTTQWTRRSILAVGSAASVAASAIGHSQSETPQEAPKTSVDLEGAIARERQRILETLKKDNIPGAAVCLIYKGSPVWVEGFGVTDEKSRRAVDAHTIFSVQSTSKNFTATAIMLAVQSGLLDLDQPITAYIPGFSVQSRFEPNPEQKMTLRLLLSHRAGFTHEAPVGNNYDPAFPDFEAHVQSISRTWLRYPVGERYAYSNLGVDLSGYILEKVSRKPFAECLKSAVFDPLGMADSTAATDVYVHRTNRATGHADGHEHVPLRIPLIPSGGVYTSAQDIGRYLAFHLNRGRIDSRPLLEEKLWEEMHGFSYGGNYSLGVGRSELRYGETPLRMLDHNGGGFGFGSVFRLYPEAELGWAALFSRPADAGYQIGNELQRELLTQQYGKERARLPIDDLASMRPRESDARKFIGNWQGRFSHGDIELSQGSLELRRDAQTTQSISFISPEAVFVPLAQPANAALILNYRPGRDRKTAWLDCWKGESILDYNDGPYDPPGEDRKEWEGWEGEYALTTWGKESGRVKVHRKNGYLYFGELRLVAEQEPGLFFTSTGEALDFRQTPVTWRNVRLTRMS